MANAGETIGPYEIQGQLGAGGMGEVYRALDRRVGRQVALKILPESLAREDDRRRRFEQEARLAASLNHPNVMAIYDVGLDSHPPYIVGELVPGESLRALIGKGPLAPRRAVDLAAQIAAGLAAAHAAGIVHRDLKPENVIVTPEGTAKILDFGVARMQAKPACNATETATMAQTGAGSVVGTAAYMSPEQARAEEVDWRSDQFSLGLVLYEMLARRQPFARPSAVQTMSAIVEDDASPIDRPLPPQLRWILDRCLAKERTGRYDSTADLARELAHLRDHYSEAASTGTGSAAIPAAAKRRRLPAIAVALAAGALLAWCAAALLRDPTTVSLAQYQLTPFATSMAVQSAPAWSPDGKSLAFRGRTETGKIQLYVQALNGANAVPVTGPGVDVFSAAPPFWTADSRFLYFNCGMGEKQGLCRVPAGGGEASLIQADVYTSSISPDGRSLVMLDNQRPIIYIASPPEAPRRKYEPLPFQSSQYFDSPILRFAPDGKSLLLFIALSGIGQTCWLLPWPPASGQRVLEAISELEFTPEFSWFPDSRHVLFSATGAGEQPRLFLGDIRTGRFWPVLAQDRPPSNPTVSPDGMRVAYQSGLSHSDIVGVPLGDGPVQTLLGSFRDQEMADMSPVTSQMVYVTNRRGVSELWITSITEGWDRPLLSPKDVQVTGQETQFFMSPRFSADGRRVVVAVGVRGSTYLYTVFASGGTPVRVTNEESGLEAGPTWSPDGNWIAYLRFQSSRYDLMKVRPGSGQPPVRIGEPNTGSVPAWSPSGEWIADYDKEGNSMLISPDGKMTRPLPGDDGPVAWARDGKTLYQVRMNPPALYAIDIASGHNRKLRDLPGLKPVASLSPGRAASLTFDGKSIVYTVSRPRQEIWLLDGIQIPPPWYARLRGR